MTILMAILQALLILLLAPFVQGVIKNVKAKLQSRRGPGIFQTYRDIAKYLKKDSVISPTVSWFFHLAPYVYFAAAVGAAAMVPTIVTGDHVNTTNLFAVVYLLALGRFFLAAASLDAGSTFGGMGGSREMFISVLVEPVLMITLFTVALRAHSTNLGAMAGAAAGSPVTLSAVLAAVAFLVLTVAETGRIPVDNPDTHLELTMIHEGMVLEYSGRSLGLITWAATIKQIVTILLMVGLFLPWNFGLGGTPAVAAWQLVKVLIVALSLAFIETGNNKIRLFRVPGLMIVTGFLSLLALMAQ